MSVVDIEKTYTSPRHKLLQFFEQSRKTLREPQRATQHCAARWAE